MQKHEERRESIYVAQNAKKDNQRDRRNIKYAIIIRLRNCEQ